MKLMSRRKALFVIGVVTALATASVVYAHWQQTLTVNVPVGTGTITMAIENAATDDDGQVNFFDARGNPAVMQDIYDTGGGTKYDRWLTASSDDPAGMWRRGSNNSLRDFWYFDNAEPRKDKDVGICSAAVVGQTLTVTVDNAYPSYLCSFRFDMFNRGSVPVKNQGGTFAVAKGGDAGVLQNVFLDGWALGPDWWNWPMGAYWGGVHELTFDFADGMWCGTQVDPDESQQIIMWLHIEQGDANSSMGKQYSIDFSIDFVNWNEWDEANCPPGTVAP